MVQPPLVELGLLSELRLLGLDCQPSYDRGMHSDRFRYSAANCSIARTLGVVGEKWTLLVLREAFYGVRRFDDFHTALGCARNLLATRLKTLVTSRTPGSRRLHGRPRPRPPRIPPDGQGPRPVSRRGRADAVGRSVERHESGPAVQLLHQDCGEPVTVELTCGAGHVAFECARHHPSAGPWRDRRRVTIGLRQ